MRPNTLPSTGLTLSSCARPLRVPASSSLREVTWDLAFACLSRWNLLQLGAHQAPRPAHWPSRRREASVTWERRAQELRTARQDIAAPAQFAALRWLGLHLGRRTWLVCSRSEGSEGEAAAKGLRFALDRFTTEAKLMRAAELIADLPAPAHSSVMTPALRSRGVRGRASLSGELIDRV